MKLEHALLTLTFLLSILALSCSDPQPSPGTAPANPAPGIPSSTIVPKAAPAPPAPSSAITPEAAPVVVSKPVKPSGTTSQRSAVSTGAFTSSPDGPCDARGLNPNVIPPIAQPSPETDTEALDALFNASDGESWDAGGNWLGRISIDQWSGVTTNANGRVIGLKLTGLNGTLPREIGNLSELEWLIIGSSPAMGELPPEVGNLSNLIHLEIDGGIGVDGGLAGKLPAEIGSLGSLQRLIIRNNYQLTGGLPVELGNLAKLKELDLSHNELCGTLPPEIGNLINLRVLALEVNRFSGNIPVELGNLVNARFIYLSDNEFTGALPEKLEYLTNTGLLLKGNQFSGCLSDYMIESGILINLPDNLEKCSPEDHEGDVETLIALYKAWGQPDWENWLGRSSIGDWKGVSIDSSGRVAALSLDLESRKLPDELGSLTALRELSLEDASGDIPDELGNLVNLRRLELSRFNRTGRTELRGEIPEELGNLSRLLTLNLGANQLTGAIPPALGNLSYLQHLSLNFNELSGELPAELGRLTNLQTMDINTNNLNGEVPAELGNLANLTYLGLKQNQISGELPRELGNLISLKRLDLLDNELSGCVPASLSQRGVELYSYALDFCTSTSQSPATSQPGKGSSAQHNAKAPSTPTTPTSSPTRVPALVVQPTPTPASAPSMMANDITITMVIWEVAEQFGDFEVQSYGGSPGETQMGFFDQLLVHDGVDPLSPFAAEKWSINDAGDELTLVIRDDLKVNTPEEFAGHDFGYITAHDVAWNMNRQNAVVNPSLGAAIGAQLGGTFGKARVVDDYTVKAPLVTDIFWGIPISEFDINDTTVRLDSKTAYETVGSEAIQLIPVGSGPFTMGEWAPNSHGEVHAVPDHWIEPPHIDKFRVVQVPEVTTRMAMIETGEADIASIDFARLRELDGKGLKFITTMSDKDTVTLSAIWPGNLWTDVNSKTGDDLEPWMSSVYGQDYAWLGCPWEDKCPYTDTNNPVGISDMEQARLVRWALSHAIDRQGIVDVLHAGLGTPIYIELMGPKFPGWHPDRTVTAAMVKAAHEKYGDSGILGTGTEWIEYQEYENAAEPNYEWPWEIPTDRAEAERLLDLAGFPKGSDGVRFEIKMNKYRCETGDLCLEQVDAVAADWEAVGVRVELLTEEYGGVVVPRMRDRTQAFPVVKNCSVETANYPFDWPPPPADSTFSRPAWGCSFESKFLDYMYININGARDKQKREELHLDMVDYYYYWQLYSGLIQLPRGVAANPNTVDSWNSRSTAASFWGRPQHIVPTK